MTTPFIPTDAIAIASPIRGNTGNTMKPRIISTLALTILLSACATTKYGWDHPTNGAAQFHSDKARCIYVAALSSGSYAPNNPRFQTAFGKALADRMDINSRRDELATYCLQSMGYVRREVN